MDSEDKNVNTSGGVDREAIDKVRKDIEDNQIMAVLAYIIFFIPLLVASKSRFAMYHANQGLLLFITAVIVNIVGTIIPIYGWLIILPLGNLAILVLAIVGIIHSANGDEKPLPLIGNFKLIKVPES